MTRRVLLSLAFVGGIFGFGPEAGAQIFDQGFNDPFTQYYGFYLPRQAALAAQPTTPQMLNNVAVARQEIIQQDRSGLYNPGASPFLGDSYDPLNPFGRGGAERLPRLSGQLIGGRSSSTPAPGHFYNRTSTYYPTFRAGASANSNMIGGGVGSGRRLNNFNASSAAFGSLGGFGGLN